MVHNQYFENESGKLVKGYGNGREGLMWYDEDGTTGTTPLSIVEEKWTQKPDIKWFPSTPVGDRETLPYVFDLLWDIKTPNQLEAVLQRSCKCKRLEIEEVMEENGITGAEK